MTKATTYTRSTQQNPLSIAAAHAKDSLVDPAIIHSLGLGRSAVQTGDGWLILCPWHPNTDTPSCHVYRTAGRVVAYCHGACERGYDVLALIAAARGLSTSGTDFRLVLDEVARLLGHMGLADLLRHLGVESTPDPRRRAGTGAAPAAPAARAEHAEIAGAVSVSDVCAAHVAQEERVSWEDRQKEANRLAAVADLRALRKAAVLPSAKSTSEYARQVADWLQYDRGFGDLGVRVLAERQLAWVLPSLRYEARPASFRGWWSSGHYLVTFLHDAGGDVVSARARCIRACPQGQKSLSPSHARSKGAIGAVTSVARAILRCGPAGWPTPPRIVLCEGEMDGLAAAISVPDDVAVFFYVSGSWTDEIAARIPDGSEVFSLNHSDEKGVKMMTRIALSLGGRCKLWCRNPEATYKRNADGSLVVEKGKPVPCKEKPDENDRLMTEGPSYDPLAMAQLTKVEVQ
jgi:hypothetical protein